MIKSKDGLISIQVVSTDRVWEAPLPSADVYVFNMPVKTEEAKTLLSRLNQGTSADSATLLTFRHSKIDLVKSMAHTADLSAYPQLTFGDVVFMHYQTTSKRGALSKLGEAAVILSKGATPLTWDQTSWYREDSTNAGNVWDLTPYSHDVKEPLNKTSYGQFSWDLGLLALCLVHPLRHRRLVWGNPPDMNLFSFAKSFKVQVECFVKTIDEASAFIKKYEELV